MPLWHHLSSQEGFPGLVARRWRTMALVLTLVLAAGTTYLQMTPPRYQATSKLLIMRTDQRLGGLNVMRDAMPKLTGDSNPLFTQVELLRIYPVFETAIRELGLRGPDGAPLAPEALARQLTILPIGQTDLIEVSYRSSDPQMAQRVVTAVCAAYMKHEERSRREGVQDGLKIVDEQLEAAKKRLEHAEKSLLGFKQGAGTVALGQEIQASVQELADLNTQLHARQIELARTRARAANLRAQLGMNSKEALEAIKIAQDPRIQGLQRQLMEAESSPLRTQGLGENHPEAIALNQRIAMLKRTIAAEVTALSGASAPVASLDSVRLELVRELAGAEAEIQAGQSSYAAATAHRTQLVSQMGRFPGQEVELGRLTREVNVASEIYQQLLQKREEARLNMAIAPTHARLIQPAELPTEPIAPLKGAGIPIILLASLAAACAAGLLKDTIDPRGLPPELAQSMRELKIFATVPALTRTERRQGDLIVGRQASPHYEEALKALAMAVESSLPGAGGRVLSLTSTAPREGKSTTLANLALALAGAGLRVLLVDADLRRPRVHVLFPADSTGPGLSEVLQNPSLAEAAIQRSGPIDVVSSGRQPSIPNIAALKLHLGPAIETWRQHYDMVLLDLPPLACMAEVATAARQTDGLLMLANFQLTPPEVLIAGIQQLQALRVPVAGVVAISQMIGQSGYGGYYLIAGEEQAS